MLQTKVVLLQVHMHCSDQLHNTLPSNQVLKRDVGSYSPDFTQCIDHFALHAGGYGVVKGLKQAMGLPVEKVMPSFAALKDFGNTSCSTTW